MVGRCRMVLLLRLSYIVMNEAREAGVVEVITLVVQWTRDGAAYFVRDDLPIVGGGL